MVRRDDDVRARLGRIRARGGQSYLPKVLKAAQKAGGLKPLGQSGKVKALSRGRGAGIAAVTAGGRLKASAARRVVVKVRYTKVAGTGMRSARAHLRYLQRDGVTPEGEAGQMYDRAEDQVSGRDFMDRCAEDTNQFRFIVSAEDGDKYSDLKPLTRRFMEQMEKDLGTRLEWVAVDHYNTGHPHTHIVLRGKDEDGRDLLIARDYIREGMRDRLEALVTLDLGPRTAREIELAQRQEVMQARYTSLDRQLIRNISLDRIVEPNAADPKMRALHVGRLNQLAAFSLAEDIGHGRWRLAGSMEATLRQMGERGDIIKALHHELALKNMAYGIEEAVIHRVEPGAPRPSPLIGQVLKRGLLDGETERHFLMLDGLDGAVHWIDIGHPDRSPPLEDDAIVRVDFRLAALKPADHTIVNVAAANSGYYDVAAHLNYDQSATEAFAETHARRLEAIRKVTGKIERQDGAFRVDDDYLDHALAYEQKRLHQAPADVQVTTPIVLSRLPSYNGATWLDRELLDPTMPIADAGFGKAVGAALQQRQAWLLQEELAFEQGEMISYRPDILARLTERDLIRAADRLGNESGLVYRPSQLGDRIDGQLRQSVNLPSGKFAMVETGKEFNLVPWRPVLDNHLGKAISGIYREEGINWTIGRSRGRGVQ